MRTLSRLRVSDPHISAIVFPFLVGALLALAGCMQPAARTAAMAVGPIPPGAARLWFYRSYEPSVSLNDANVSLNGARVVTVNAVGTPIYRDVPAGAYHVTVDSYDKDTNQAKDIALAPGQEGFVKILAADLGSSGGTTEITRDTFYVSLVSPQVARSELAMSNFGG